MSDVEVEGLPGPPIDLREKAPVLTGKEAYLDPVARAEKALAGLSTNFAQWMSGEIETLIRAWHEAARTAYNTTEREALFASAHSIKGLAATLGFPLIGEAAASLCALLAHSGDFDKISVALIEHHVQSIRAIHAQDAHGSDRQMARDLVDCLLQSTASLGEAGSAGP